MSGIAFPYTFILLILLGLAFGVGLISTRRIINHAEDEALRQKLSAPIRRMSATGLAIAVLCAFAIISQVARSVSTNLVLQQFDEVGCLETPITDQYKMVVTQRRDSEQEASIAHVQGEVELIWVEQYSVTDNYLMGVTNGHYFWLDRRTGGRRILDTRDEFLASLTALGVSQVPEFLSVNSLCATRQCQPCVTHPPSP